MRLSFSLFAAAMLPLPSGAFVVNHQSKSCRIASEWNDENRCQEKSAQVMVRNMDMSQPEDTILEFDGYLEKVEKAFGRAQYRMENMRKEMRAKELDSARIVQAIEERMKNQEAELTNKLEYMGAEFQNVKVQEQQKRQEIFHKHRTREEQLEREMQYLVRQVEEEKRDMQSNRKAAEATLARKAELEAELEDLRRKMDVQTNEWNAKYKQEQEARRQQVEQAKLQMEEMEAKAKVAAEQAQGRIANLQNELTNKEKEKQGALETLREEMRAQEEAFQKKADEMSSEATAAKEAALQEKQLLLNKSADREIQLQQEVDHLRNMLDAEKVKIIAHQEGASRLVAARTQLDTELTELRRQYERESLGWTEKYRAEQEARRLEVTEAQQQMLEQEQQAVAAVNDFQTRLASMHQFVAFKEQEKNAAVNAVKEKMQAQLVQLKNDLQEMGTKLTGVKLQAHREKMAVIDEYTARERKLQEEVECIQSLVEAEKQKFIVNQAMSNDILTKRVELEAELGSLKRKYQQESQAWSAKFQAEHEMRTSEVAGAQRQLEQQQEQAIQEAKEQLDRLSALQGQLSAKEKEKQAAISAIKTEMKSQEEELRAEIKELGVQNTNIKLDSEKEKQAIIDEYEMKQQLLQEEMNSISLELEAERERVRTNQEKTALIVAERIELESELGRLQREFKQERENWSEQYQAEHEARQKEIAMAKDKLEETQRVALLEAKQLHGQILSLKEQLSNKEKQKQAAILAIKQENQIREKELKDKASEIGLQLTHAKLDAHKKRMELIQSFKAREEALGANLRNLEESLDIEKENLRVNQRMTGRIVSERVGLECELGNLKREFDQDRQNWSLKEETERAARKREAEEKQRALEAQQQESLKEAVEFQTRISSLKEQLSTKERNKQAAILAIQGEMKAREKELQEKVLEMGTEVTNIKLDAHRDKIAAIDAYKAREVELQKNIADLHKVIEREKENLRVNQGTAHQILAQRIEMEMELGRLNRELREESRQWNAKFDNERAARQLVVLNSKRALEEHQKQAHDHAAELHARVANLEEQISAKEKMKVAAVMAIKNEMRTQKAELTQKANDIGHDLTKMKIAANNEKMEMAEQNNAREKRLHEEIDRLQKQLDGEKAKLQLNEDERNRILADRIEIESELSQLKQDYEKDSKNWDAKYAAQQEARKQEVLHVEMQLKQEQGKGLLEAQALQDRVASLQGQLSAKEKRMQTEVLSVKEEMKAQEEELKKTISDMGLEITNVKLEAHNEKMAICELLKVRERQLEEAKDGFRDLLDAEKAAIKVNKDLTNRILAQRVSIDAELGELKRRYAQEHQEWDARYCLEQEARKIEVDKVRKEMIELQHAAEKEAQEAENRRIALADQLSQKELEKHVAISKLEGELKVQEQRFQEKIRELGLEATNFKIEAHREKLAIVKEYAARADQLNNEIDSLQTLLDAEKKNIEMNKELTNKVLSQRNELKTELGVLQHRYESESKEWDAKYAKEQEMRRTQVAQAQEETKLVQLNAERAAVDAELRRSSLLKQLAAKELEKETAIDATQKEMKALEEDLKVLLKGMSDEFAEYKHKAHNEKLSAIKELQAREQDLLQQLHTLRQQQAAVASKGSAINGSPGTSYVRWDKQEKQSEEAQEQLKQEIFDNQVIQKNVKLLLQQGRIEDAMQYLN